MDRSLWFQHRPGRQTRGQYSAPCRSLRGRRYVTFPRVCWLAQCLGLFLTSPVVIVPVLCFFITLGRC